MINTFDKIVTQNSETVSLTCDDDVFDATVAAGKGYVGIVNGYAWRSL